MKNYFDSRLLKCFVHDQHSEESFFKACLTAGMEEIPTLHWNWPSILTFLGLEDTINGAKPNKQWLDGIVSALSHDVQEADLIRLYDQAFVECITKVRALPLIQPGFFLSQLSSKCVESIKDGPNFLLPGLDACEKRFREDPANAFHDLILYLAWNNVCAFFGEVFDYQASAGQVFNGLEVFKACLLESFQHITEQGRTAPGFWKLLEALYAYQMREEKLAGYTEKEWLVLCQTAQTLRPVELLADVPYVDHALIHLTTQIDGFSKRPLLRVFSLDSPARVQASLAFADYMCSLLEQDILWKLGRSPVQVVCLSQNGDGIHFESILSG